jgi:hypothetical protein
LSINEIISRQLRVQGAAISEQHQLDEFNILVRRRLEAAVDAIGAILPGGAFDEERKKDNTFLVTAGQHAGAIFDKPDTDLRAIGPGAIFGRRIVLEADAVIEGVTLSGDDAGEALGSACAHVKSPAVVIFRGCAFERPEDSVASMVLVDDGAKVTMLGCVFKGSGTTSSPVVSHPAGAATDVQIAYSYNKTGNTLFTPGDATGTGNH